MKRVLLLGEGPWVVGLEDALRSAPGMGVAARCEDLPDLLARSAAGLGDVAIVAGDVGGLDLEGVSTLRRRGVAVVAVAASPDAREWLARLGVDRAVPPLAESSDWVEMIGGISGPPPGPAPRGRCFSVWGTTGGPGATTVAIALALASSVSGARTLLVDLDPDGASVAQQLGLADSGSGIERACRAAQSGTLTSELFESLTSTTVHGTDVLTGVLRPDRWVDLRRSAIEAVLEVARTHYDRVVCDVGSDIYDVADDGGTPRPSTATAVGVDIADHLVLVGSADSVGVARLLRGVDRLTGGASAARRADIVVNQWRPTVGWSQGELVGLLGEVAPGVRVFVLPQDVAAADAAAHGGGSPWLCRKVPGKEGEASLGKALHAMTDGVLGLPARGRAAITR